MNLLAKPLSIFIICCLFAQPAAAETRRLTADGTLKMDPAFVDRTASELVFAIQESPSLVRLMRLKLSDGSITPVNPEQMKNEFEPAYTVDGSFLASVQSRGNLSMA